MKEEHVAGINLSKTINAEGVRRIDEYPCARLISNLPIKQLAVPRTRAYNYE
jgi:hypothetical protein